MTANGATSQVPAHYGTMDVGHGDGARSEEKQEQDNRRFGSGHRGSLLHGAMQAMQHPLSQEEVQRHHAVHQDAADEELLLPIQPGPSVGEGPPPEKSGAEYDRTAHAE